LLSTTFKEVKIEKMSQAFNITIASTPPPMIGLKYWSGYLYWSHWYDIETSEPSG